MNYNEAELCKDCSKPVEKGLSPVYIRKELERAVQTLSVLRNDKRNNSNSDVPMSIEAIEQVRKILLSAQRKL